MTDAFQVVFQEILIDLKAAQNLKNGDTLDKEMYNIGLRAMALGSLVDQWYSCRKTEISEILYEVAKFLETHTNTPGNTRGAEITHDEEIEHLRPFTGPAPKLRRL